MTHTEALREYLRTCDLQGITTEKVAAHFNVPYGTFRGRLYSEGATFARLLFQERKRRCLELLRENPKRSLDAVSREVGLSGQRTSLCFPRWTGYRLCDFRFGNRRAEG